MSGYTRKIDCPRSKKLEVKVETFDIAQRKNILTYILNLASLMGE